MTPPSSGRGLGFALLLLLTLLPAALQAQQIQGRLLDKVDARPLAGAYVVLLQDGLEVASTVTRVDGGFRLVAPAPGPYTLRADHLGYGVTEEQLIVPPPGEALQVELAMAQQAIELEGLTAEVDRQCDVPRLVAVQVAGLWDEVGEAFRVAALLEERQLYDMRLDTWRRSLDPGTLEVLEERRRQGRGIQRGSPFESLPPERLAENGYVLENEEGGFSYFAPDARVLLSMSFQDTHCFGVTIQPPEDGGSDWVGIRFEPRHGDHPDIRGVLWIDAANLEPQRLDFRYTELPGRVGSQDLGGRVSFQRLPDGPWIVREWRIRMPRIQAQRYYTFDSSEPRYRYEIAGIDEVGGQVTQAGPRGGELVVLGDPGAVQGVVRTASGAVQPDAEVVLEGTYFRTRTDSRGDFHMGGIPQGRYRLAYSAPFLDSLGLGGGGQPLQVEAGETVRVEARLPSPAALLAEACQEPVVPGETAVLHGVVRRPDGRPTAGAEVELTWAEEILPRDSGGRVLVRQAHATATLPVEEDGRWLACGLPSERPIQARARWTGTRRGEGVAREVRLRADAFPLVELSLPVPAQAEADPVDGDPDATPVERYVLQELANLGVRPETLGRRYAGPERVEGMREGAMGAVDMVRVLGLPGIRVRTLRSGETCIYSSRNTRSVLGGGAPEPECAAIVVDGVPGDIRLLESLPGETVAALAYLRPSEAGARLGGGTMGGAMVVWTLRGVR